MDFIISFRSYPIEFYTTSHYDNYIDEIGDIYSHKSTYFALETLKKTLPVPVIGVIEPGAISAFQSTKNGKIGVIGTDGTIRSKAYHEAIRKSFVELEELNYTFKGKIREDSGTRSRPFPLQLFLRLILIDIPRKICLTPNPDRGKINMIGTVPEYLNESIYK